VTYFRKTMLYIFAILYLGGAIFSQQVLADDYAENVTAQKFFKEMEERHDFDGSELRKLFSRVYRDQRILDLISKPAEKRLAWRDYRKIFLDNARIRNGIKFWEENERVISDVSARYGVPGEIIAAIIGVETRYGKVTGSHRVISALSTLAFDYPPRSRFFRKELESFLLLTREEGKSPLELKGSYAGAMGYGQFMPSSYRAYAVDSDKDGKRDIWNSRADAIGSVANYLSAHNWEKGAGVAIRVELDSELNGLDDDSFSELRPNLTGSQLLKMGFKVPSTHLEKTVALIRLRSDAESEYWLGEWNFYVITRYNRSPMYAMAVLQLAEALRIGRS
jgi:membrane-bound lytic murein transglycosylase B